MRVKYHQWAVDYLDEHPEVCIEKVDLDNPFFKKPLRLEIGSGKGDFIVGFAQKFPSFNYLAIEKVRTCAGIMAKKIVEAELTNTLVFPNDIYLLFEQLKPGSIDTIYLNFSDPWPKKKHTKRRLTYINFLNSYYELLKEGGYLIFKSDNDSLYEFTMEEIQNSKFKLVESLPDYKFDEENDVMTEYEVKFRGKGQPIHKIVLRK